MMNLCGETFESYAWPTSPVGSSSTALGTAFFSFTYAFASGAVT